MTREEAAEGIRKFRNSISRDAEIFRSPDPYVQSISMYSAKILYGYEFIEELNMAIEALHKMSEIEEIVQACEGCEEAYGYREYPRTQAYQHIVEAVRGER